MKSTTITTIRQYQDAQRQVQEKARKRSKVAGILAATWTAGLFLGGMAILKPTPEPLGWGPYAAAGIMAALFGTLALLIIRTTYLEGKLEGLLSQFQHDVRTQANSTYRLAVQHDAIHPDLQERVAYAAGDGQIAAVKAYFPDEHSQLIISELAPGKKSIGE